MLAVVGTELAMASRLRGAGKSHSHNDCLQDSLLDWPSVPLEPEAGLSELLRGGRGREGEGHGEGRSPHSYGWSGGPGAGVGGTRSIHWG